ncbi:MAG: type III pantothenate kinase [Bacteroidota bacterium]
MILALDIGNTRTKLGLFKDGKLAQVFIADTQELPEALSPVLEARKEAESLQMGWMSVASEVDPEKWAVWKRFAKAPRLVHIKSGYPFPIENRYATPETLGTDRIVAAIGAYAHEQRAVLIIDAGTAITYDYVTTSGAYLGGGISPGLGMRFRALHEFTARLPLIEAVEDPPLIGTSTKRSIQSGVLNGLRTEVAGMIHQYQSHHGADLAVYLTGGDAPYFEKLGKNLTFADANLTLSGIHFILTQQSGL